MLTCYEDIGIDLIFIFAQTLQTVCWQEQSADKTTRRLLHAPGRLGVERQFSVVDKPFNTPPPRPPPVPSPRWRLGNDELL